MWRRRGIFLDAECDLEQTLYDPLLLSLKFEKSFTAGLFRGAWVWTKVALGLKTHRTSLEALERGAHEGRRLSGQETSQ